MLRVPYTAISAAGRAMAVVAGNLGCGTPLADVAGAADETAAAGALDAMASAWLGGLADFSAVTRQMGTALEAAGECYRIADRYPADIP